MRMRVEYEKGPSLRYLSHLDMVRAWERLVRRAGVRVEMSQGYNPHPRISLGTVLPVGIWGRREYLDLELEGEQDPVEVLRCLQRKAPPGLAVRQGAIIDSSEPSLMAAVNACLYCLALADSGDGIARKALKAIGEADALPVWHERKNRFLDIKPLIYSLDMVNKDGQPVIEAFTAVNLRVSDLIHIFTENGLSEKIITDVWREECRIVEGNNWRRPIEDL